MVLTLALVGCGWQSPADVEIRGVVPDPADLQGSSGLLIATVPDRELPLRARVIESPLPAGKPIVRDCFGFGERERFTRGPPPPPPPARQPTMRPRAAAPTPEATMPAMPAESAPLPGATGSAPSLGDRGVGHGGGGLLGGTLGGETSGAVPVGAAPAKPSAEPVAVEKQDPARRQSPADNGAADLQEQRRSAKSEEDSIGLDEIATKETAKKKIAPRPVLDWGANVYLSNDDSMSLASAQRMLFALSRGVPISPSEVRPHELLNYFSFDTVAPKPGATFGVLGSAVQEGDSLTVALAVRGSNEDRQPLDLTLALDRSCSMAAEGRMEYTKRGLTSLSENLQRGDRLDIVLFDSGVCTPLENFVVGRDDPSLLTSLVQQLAPTGATDLDGGLREAYRIQTSRDQGDRHGRNQRVLLVTDAELNTGNVNEALVSEVGRQLDENDIRLSGVGVGREFNDQMLDLLTEKGKGAYVYLGSEAVVDRIFGPGFDALVRTVAHDVHFSLDLPDSLAMERFYGEEASTVKEEVQPIHYHAGNTQLFLQDLAIRDGRIVRDDPIVMRIEYRDAVTMEPEVQELRTTVGALLDADPHNLRKGRALMAFADWTMAGAMGADPCAEPLSTYRSRSSLLGDDAEIVFVNGLVGGRCGVPLQTVAAPAPSGVDLKVKVDSDIPIAEIELDCAGRSHVEPLSGSDTVARFRAVSPGACTVKLAGNLPMSASVEVPLTGGDLRCIVRGGRISCS